MVWQSRWILKKTKEWVLPPFEELLLSFIPLLAMNIIVWNCRGALNPNFQDYVQDLAQQHDPAIFVVMKTHIGGDRARDITNKLLFDGAIHTETIGQAGGLWLLWNLNRVEVPFLASSEQEIHFTMKVHSSNFSWMFSTVYASP